MSDQSGGQGVAGGAGGGDGAGGGIKSAVVMYAASVLRGIIIAAVAKLSPALVEDPGVKWLVELVSIALAVMIMAWVSTRSTMKRVGTASGQAAGEVAAMMAGGLTLTDEDEAKLEAAFARAKIAGLTGSRVGSAGAGDGWGESSALAEIPIGMRPPRPIPPPPASPPKVYGGSSRNPNQPDGPPPDMRK